MGGEQICIALTSSPYCHLSSLFLENTGIGMNTIKVLGEYLISPSSSHLSELYLSRNDKIGDNEVEILCAALSLNSTLQSLSLFSCNIGDRGASAIQYLIINYNSSLSNINLNSNYNISKQLKQQIENLAVSKNRIKVKKTPPPYPYSKSQNSVGKMVKIVEL